MLIITGIFENERFIPDARVPIPQRKRVIVTIEESPQEEIVPANRRLGIADIIFGRDSLLYSALPSNVLSAERSLRWKHRQEKLFGKKCR